MDNKCSELGVASPRRMGAGTEGGRADANVDGVDVEGVEEGGAEEDGTSDHLPLNLWVPRKETEGSSRFQQFFLTYAKLMAGLKLSKVKESEVTPRALHKAVMRAGKPSLEESC